MLADVNHGSLIWLDDQEVSRIVFHFNKGFLTDSSIPMWTVKHKGKTYYVNHMDSNIGFSTKETPDSDHTKGSIQFRGKLKIIEKDGSKTATIS